jgi:hypothetical protein
MIRSNTRTGATLTEVLVAIFVMAIGLLALLTLFPLGALSMAQAIKDDRTAHAGKNGSAIASGFRIEIDPVSLNISNATPSIPVYTSPLAGPPPSNSTSLFLNPYPDQYQAQPATALSLYLPPDLKNNPIISAAAGLGIWDGSVSYPVFIDPYGWANFGSRWVGYNPATGLPTPPFSGAPAPALIPRQPLSFISGVQGLDRWCTLTDDITFSAGKSPTELADAGLPALSTGTVQRENRYTWAWMARLQDYTQMTQARPNDSVQADIQVIVYSGRSLTSQGETAYPNVIFGGYWDATQATPLVSSKSFVDIPYQPGNRPTIRMGTWILDSTMCYTTGGVTLPDPHGYFYRVVGVTDLGPLPTATTTPAGPYPPNTLGLRLEIQGTFKNSVPTYLPATGPYGVLVVMENVAEVFP